MGFIDWLGFGKQQKKEIRYDLSPDSIKENNLIRGQQNQITELQADNAKFKAKESEKRELEEQKQEEEKIKVYLQEDKKQLDQQNAQKFFSMKTFFSKYFKNEKFRNNLKITTFDRSTNLGIFGDFGFSGNQFVILNDKGQKILGTRELKDLFQSVGALGNDISSGKIPINLDKDGGWIENPMMWEAPEIIREEEGFRYSKARKRPFYELLKENDAKLQQAYSELDEAETSIIKLQDKVDELELVNKSSEKSGEIARAERVKTAKKVSNIDKMWSDIETELTQLRQIGVITEDNVTKLENQLKIMMTKAEGEETKLAFEKALEEVERIRSTLVREMPEKEVETQIIEKKV